MILFLFVPVKQEKILVYTTLMKIQVEKGVKEKDFMPLAVCSLEL